MRKNIKNLLLSVAIISTTKSVLADYDFKDQHFNHARVMIELNSEARKKLKEHIEFESNNARSSPALSLQHLKNILGDQYNKNLDLRQNVDKTFSLNHFQNMLHEIPVLKASGFSRGENLTRQDKDHLIKEVTKMIQEETKHEGAYAIYSAVNSHYAAFQDLFKKLNEILREKHIDSSFRFGTKDFGKVKDFEDFRRKILQDPEHDNAWLFKILGVCGSLSPLQTSSTESAMYFWSHNYNISETDLLPFILKSLNIKEDIITEFAGSMKNIIDLSWKLGSRMKQIFMDANNLDHYTWLSGRNGHEFSSVNLLPNGEIESTFMPSQALSFYRKSPEDFIKYHRENFDKYVVPSLGSRLSNAVDKDELSQPIFGKRKNDNYHIGQLQFRLFLHPDLMNGNKILIKEYYSQNNSEDLFKNYNLAIEKLAIKIINSALKSNEKSDEIKSSPFHKSIEIAKKSKTIANAEAERVRQQQAREQELRNQEAERVRQQQAREQEARRQAEAQREANALGMDIRDYLAMMDESIQLEKIRQANIERVRQQQAREQELRNQEAERVRQQQAREQEARRQAEAQREANALGMDIRDYLAMMDESIQLEKIRQANIERVRQQQAREQELRNQEAERVRQQQAREQEARRQAEAQREANALGMDIRDYLAMMDESIQLEKIRQANIERVRQQQAREQELRNQEAERVRQQQAREQELRNQEAERVRQQQAREQELRNQEAERVRQQQAREQELRNQEAERVRQQQAREQEARRQAEAQREANALGMDIRDYLAMMDESIQLEKIRQANIERVRQQEARRQAEAQREANALGMDIRDYLAMMDESIQLEKIRQANIERVRHIR